MKAFKLVNASFVEVEDPTSSPDGGDVAELMQRAGYSQQVSSDTDLAGGAQVSLWVREAAPRFYIDLMGLTNQIASVVADDFPSLVSTMKELHPLLTLVGLDQHAAAQVEQSLAVAKPSRLRGGRSGTR